ncbi:MAG TPA: 50S ribosomal protein L6 [bacterium]|jgi:large subunit ribosomal protein L6
MSRIGTLPVKVPSGTEVSVKNSTFTAKGQHGSLSVDFNAAVTVDFDDSTVMVKSVTGLKSDKKWHGLYRALINNAVIGVSEGFTRKLELIGVGYRAAISGKDIVLDVGYSNSKTLPIPDGITATVDNNTLITLWGINKHQLGQFAANIREVRPPEPYKGKGIRYQGERVRKKAGKAGAVGKGAS